MQGVRVLDFGQYIAGPAAAAILGDLGAEVIHIDPPGGRRWTSPAARCFDRGKKQTTLNLKDPADLQRAVELVKTADVVIENFRPGVMTRLGLGPDDCVAHNPALVYLSLPGFASTDAERRERRAWEAVIAAESGQLAEMGFNRVLMGIRPSFTPLTLASAFGAVFGVAGVCSALYRRTRTGRGARIEVPLGTALMEGLVYHSMYIDQYPARYQTLREKEYRRRLAAGEPLDMTFEELQPLLDPFYRSYICSDGRPLLVVNTSHRKHVHNMLDIVGLLDEARAAGMPELEDWYQSTRDWPEGVDCSLGLYPLPQRWVGWFFDRMQEKLQTKSAFEWEEIFGAAGIPAVAHRTSEEWLNWEHALRSGLVHEYDDETLGRVRQAGPAVWLESGASQVARHTAMEPVAEAVGFTAPGVTSNLDGSDPAAGWLAGVRVLDMTNVIAGPTVGSILARFGAEVIKVDPVRSNYDPWNTVVFGMQAGRGKRSVLLDAKAPAGQPVLAELVGWADVVTINKSVKQLARLGLDPESLARLNPRAVLLRLDAFGGPEVGSKSGHAGYDILAQGVTGVTLRFGGSYESPEEHAHVGTIDILCGVAGAAGIAAALVERERTGRPDAARCSLASVVQLAQAPFLIDYAGRGPWDEPSGREVRGHSALYRLYQASDDWLFLAATDADLPQLQTCLGCGDLSNLTDADRIAVMAERFRLRPRAAWVQELSAANIGVGAVRSAADLRGAHVDGDPSSTYKFDRFENHPSEREVIIPTPCAIRTPDAEVLEPRVTEKYGTSTRAVLTELGHTEPEIAALIQSGVVSESWSTDYLPD